MTTKNIHEAALASVKELGENSAEFVIKPLYYGYGNTLGNSLRRVLLSSIKGAAITAFAIEGSNHEYAAIPGIREDVVDIMLNLKNIRFKVHTDAPIELNLEMKGDKQSEKDGDKRVRGGSLYLTQLREKQKVRRMYGLLEKQFAKLMREAQKSDGLTGEKLLEYLERRADNVVFRSGFALTRRQARQLVSHGHFLLNGRKIDIPSIRLNPGDVLEVRPRSAKTEYFKNLANIVGAANVVPLSWLKVDAKKMKIEVTGLPKREEAEAGINEQLIVEYYSR